MATIHENSSFASLELHKPVCAGHRGFKAALPENTIAAMKGAIAVGASIIETDVQVSGDGVVVIAHDETTTRCFGESKRIATSDYYGDLEELRTIDEPHERMPTFKEVATLFAEDPAFKGVQLMLDVKRNNEPWVVKKVVQVLEQINPDMEGFWAKRMVLGVWRLDVLAECEVSAPQLPIVHIGIQKWLARRFLQHEQVVGISMHHLTLNLPGGYALIKEAKEAKKLVYSWTVNTMPVMKWAAAANLDGVVTDYPDVFSKFVRDLTPEDVDKIYSRCAPSGFFSWLETLVWMPLSYLRTRWRLQMTLLELWLTPKRKQC